MEEGPEDISAAWDDVLSSARSSADMLLDVAGDDDVDRAEAVRYASHLLRHNLERNLEERDTGDPRFVPRPTEGLKYFGDNPDTDYLCAKIDGRFTYRIRGRRGNALYMSVCVYGRTPGGDPTLVALNDTEIDFAEDGSFDVVLSPTEHEGNWLATDMNAMDVAVRQYYLDRSEEKPIELEIAAENGPGATPLSGESLAGALRAAAKGTLAMTRASLPWGSFAAASPPNSFDRPFVTRTTTAAMLKMRPTPDNEYLIGTFQLESDQYLEICFVPPSARYWGVHLMNRWMQSIGVHGHGTLLNAATAETDADGVVRILVGHRDPGHPNWLDTGGHRHGYVAIRSLMPDVPGAPVVPEVRVVSGAVGADG